MGEKSDFQGKREEHQDTLTNGGSSAGNAADCQQQPSSPVSARNHLKKTKALCKLVKNIRNILHEIAAVRTSEDFHNIGIAAQKSITYLKKKLTYYEKEAHAAMLTGEDTDITLHQVHQTVKEARHAVRRVKYHLRPLYNVAKLCK